MLLRNVTAVAEESECAGMTPEGDIVRVPCNQESFFLCETAPFSCGEYSSGTQHYCEEDWVLLMEIGTYTEFSYAHPAWTDDRTYALDEFRNQNMKPSTRCLLKKKKWSAM